MKTIKVNIENMTEKELKMCETDEELRKSFIETDTKINGDSSVTVKMWAYIRSNMSSDVFVYSQEEGDYSFDRIASMADLANVKTGSDREDYNDERSNFIEKTFSTLRKANLFIIDTIEKISELNKTFLKMNADRKPLLITGKILI